MAEQIYIENLNQPITITSSDPAIRQLADTINDMIERLEKAVRKQSIFISDASHEMRTPISVIKGYTDLMDRWGKRDPRILQESIEAIKAETEHMNKLINSLLVLAKSPDNGALMEKQPISLNAVASEAIRESALLHQTDEFELVELSQETITADYDMILQMTRVFVDNSIKYGGDKNDPVQIIVSGDVNGSHLTVKDYGIGIDEEDLPFIFERFYRADKSRSSKIPGFGLGLAVADMIARAHRATVCVYSELGAGTEFTVTFPKDKSSN